MSDHPVEDALLARRAQLAAKHDSMIASGTIKQRPSQPPPVVNTRAYVDSLDNVERTEIVTPAASRPVLVFQPQSERASAYMNYPLTGHPLDDVEDQDTETEPLLGKMSEVRYSVVYMGYH
jgi:hypothetical protein